MLVVSRISPQASFLILQAHCKCSNPVPLSLPKTTKSSSSLVLQNDKSAYRTPTLGCPKDISNFIRSKTERNIFSTVGGQLRHGALVTLTYQTSHAAKA